VSQHRIELDEASHVYRVAGIERPSVTQVLRAAGLIDTAWYTEVARIRGRAVHAACEFLDQDDLDESSVLPEYRGYVHAWMRFRAESGFRAASAPETGRPMIEHRLFHPVFAYCGTLDRCGWLGGDEVVLDLKTGGPADWHAHQLAAYSNCLPNPLARRRIAVHLKACGAYSIREYPNTEFHRHWQVFAACLVIWQAKHRKAR
jgi:hypothetical protein